VPNADTPAQKVENGIGQGTVTVSPFGLAVAEASLGHGSTITRRSSSTRRPPPTPHPNRFRPPLRTASAR
jgi:hypothetical protein